MKRCQDIFGGLALSGVLTSRDSEIRGAIVWIAKTDAILKRPVNKLLPIDNTYHDTNQNRYGKGTKVKARSSRNWLTKGKCEC